MLPQYLGYARWNPEFQITEFPKFIFLASGKMFWFICAMPSKSTRGKRIFPTRVLGKNGARMVFQRMADYDWRIDYPHATKDTYQGVSAYIYCVEETSSMHPLPDIPDAVVSPEPVAVKSCKWIPDAYEEIQKALRDGLITLVSYEQGSEAWHQQIGILLREDYEKTIDHPEYRHFLEGKFPSLHF